MSVIEHFTARAERYDRSSSWCTDNDLLDLIFASAEVSPTARVLDVACGTGLVSARFKGHVAELVGLDITPAMAEQARDRLDTFVSGSAHELPFPDAHFDAVVCRQGIQFMDLDRALPEMMRVLKPGGRLVTADLHCYGDDDRDEYFEVLRLRNPARKNFFAPGDLEARLPGATHTRYISREDVAVWADNGAISDARQQKLLDVYRDGSDAFLRLHAAEVGERVIDHMLFHVTVVVK